MNRECRVCGGPVYGRSDKLYCSSRCRRDASRVRQQAPKTDPRDLRQTLPQAPADRRSGCEIRAGWCRGRRGGCPRPDPDPQSAACTQARRGSAVEREDGWAVFPRAAGRSGWTCTRPGRSPKPARVSPHRPRLAALELSTTANSPSPSQTDSSSANASARGDAAALRLHRVDVERNRQAWNGWAPDFYRVGLEYWLLEEPVWGIWGTPESRLGLLAGVDGVDAVELGCGTGHVCAWLAGRGAVPVGIDVSEEQLESARMFQRQFQRLFPLVRASADDVPLDDGRFDFAISEYGASTWLDPYWWVPEAARLLRPGGKLVFFVAAR